MPDRSPFVGELVHHVRRFGDVRVDFDLPVGIVNPIAFSDETIASKLYFITQCEIVFTYDPPDRPKDVEYRLVIPRRFAFDGASIPRKLWGVDGFSPLEEHIWAALPHDWICEHPNVLPRGVGDACFNHILEQLAAEKKLEVRQAFEMYAGVRLWTRLKQWVLEVK